MEGSETTWAGVLRPVPNAPLTARTLNSDSPISQVYRDGAGRLRIESTMQMEGKSLRVVTLIDPVAHSSFMLMPDFRTGFLLDKPRAGTEPYQVGLAIPSSASEGIEFEIIDHNEPDPALFAVSEDFQIHEEGHEINLDV